jgi:hypothetical protein
MRRRTCLDTPGSAHDAIDREIGRGGIVQDCWDWQEYKDRLEETMKYPGVPVEGKGKGQISQERPRGPLSHCGAFWPDDHIELCTFPLLKHSEDIESTSSQGLSRDLGRRVAGYLESEFRLTDCNRW